MPAPGARSQRIPPLHPASAASPFPVNLDATPPTGTKGGADPTNDWMEAGNNWVIANWVTGLFSLKRQDSMFSSQGELGCQGRD